MPSDPTCTERLTARCYCGATRLEFSLSPQTVAYCHCSDCRRWTGAPVAAFAAFDPNHMRASPDLGVGRSHATGVVRYVCADCGSPIAACFDYLPDQVYVPLGIIEESEQLPPQIHCHTNAQLPWLHLEDNLPRQPGSARVHLSDASPCPLP